MTLKGVLCCGLDSEKLFWTAAELINTTDQYMIILYKNDRHEVDQSYAGVLHVDAPVDVVILFSTQPTVHGDRFQGDIKADFCAEDLKNNCNRLYMDTSTLRHTTRTQDMHMNWHPGVHGPIVELNAEMACICVVSSLKDPDGLSLQLFSFKVHDHGLALQASFQHLFNLGLLSPSSLGSSIESSHFASLCLSFRQ